jgi:hypothetical protein
MPKIEQTIADVNVRAHTFKASIQACLACHKDKNADWTKQAIAKWPNFSPWRFE